MMRYVPLFVLGLAMHEATAMDLEMMGVTLTMTDRPEPEPVAVQEFLDVDFGQVS